MTKKPTGPPAWLDLFDTAQMDHVCERVCNAIEEAASGIPSHLHDPLRRLLIGPLEQYIEDHWKPDHAYMDVAAAERLRDRLEDLEESFAQCRHFSKEQAKPIALALRFAWLEFIAYGAAYLMYWKRHKEWVQKAAIAKKPRARAKKLTPEGLVAWLKQQGADKLTDSLAGEAAQAYRIGVRTIYRRAKEARSKGLLP